MAPCAAAGVSGRAPSSNGSRSGVGRLAPGLTALVWCCLACGDGGVATPTEALQLHESAIVIDTHSDTTPWFEDPDWRFDERHADGHMDLPRIREGGLDVQFWSIWMGRIEGEGRAVRNAP